MQRKQSVKEVPDSALKDRLVRGSRDISVQPVPAALAMPHFTKDPAIRACDAFNSKDRTVRIDIKGHRWCAGLISILGGYLPVSDKRIKCWPVGNETAFPVAYSNSVDIALMGLRQPRAER